MPTKRIILFVVLLFLGFLFLYTLNIRTHSLDKLSANTGLEIAGTTLKTVDSATQGLESLWLRYVYLVGVAEENIQLKKELEVLKAKEYSYFENRAELDRLRNLMGIIVPEDWNKIVARVTGGKLGAFSALESVIINKGYLSGVMVGRPILTQSFLLGRVYKASATNSMGLLITDLGSRVAVISSESRVQGILSGAGASKPMEVHFINQDSSLYPGEILYTSGIDGVFPKGIAVAKINHSQPLLSEAFHIYYADPLANVTSLEEVIVLTPPTGWQERDFPVYSRPLEEEIPLMELLP